MSIGVNASSHPSMLLPATTIKKPRPKVTPVATAPTKHQPTINLVLLFLPWLIKTIPGTNNAAIPVTIIKNPVIPSMFLLLSALFKNKANVSSFFL